MGRGSSQLLFGNVSARNAGASHPVAPASTTTRLPWSRLQHELSQAAQRDSWRRPPTVTTSAYFSARAYEQLRPFRYLAISPNYYEDDYGFEIVLASDPGLPQANFVVFLVGERSRAAIVDDQAQASLTDLDQAITLANAVIADQDGRWPERRTADHARIHFDRDEILASLVG